MPEEMQESGKNYDIPVSTLLESKIRENIYELNLKRKLLEESRSALTKLDSEKHEQVQRAEKAERELSETKIHLEVAIKAAREAEAERSSGRELLIRQRAQLEACTKEREMLQQLNRNQQIEICDLKRNLEDCRSKMKSQTYIFEIIQNKYTQTRTTFDSLTSEMAKLENSLRKLKEVCKKVAGISSVIIVLLNQRKTEVSSLKKENSDLQDKVISLTVQLEKLRAESSKNLEGGQTECDHMLEWISAQKEMQARLEESINETNYLQSSLDSALTTLARYQTLDLQNSEKIRALEEELKNRNSHFQKETKLGQTDEQSERENEVILKQQVCSIISSCEIQSSEVDTCEKNC